MYVVVTYDADPEERKSIRSIVSTQLHWIQESVYSGELTRTEADDLFRKLSTRIKDARISFWLFDRSPEVKQIGTQTDKESIFL